MSDDLKARAERAAAAIIAEHDLAALGVSYELLVAVIAIGWVEGRQAGGDEARLIIHDALTRATRGGLHSVKS